MWKWASPWALVLPEARTSSVYPSSFFFLYSMCTVRRYFVLYCTYTYVLLCCLSRLFSYKAIMSDVATAAFDRTTITDFSLSLSLSLSFSLRFRFLSVQGNCMQPMPTRFSLVSSFLQPISS